jgi:hypothetical protein
MKYVVMRVTVPSADNLGFTREFPVVFPDALTHKDVVTALRKGCPELRRAEAVAAGFLSCTYVGQKGACHGKSESLGGLKSRGEVDDALMYMLDYSHGIV